MLVIHLKISQQLTILDESLIQTQEICITTHLLRYALHILLNEELQTTE